MKKYPLHILSRIQSLRTTSKIKLLLVAGLLIWFWLSIPKNIFTAPTSYVIEDKDGNLLNATIAADGQWRFPYNKNIPQKFIDCITTFEDKRFFKHPGIDPVSISRAIIKNIKNKKVVQGGSTITMQVIRLIKKDESRSIWNKLKESILAVRLELSYSKKEILALYAGNAPFGSNVVGLDAAAWRYYGRSADKLSWGEMATLAVLPNAPALVHPGKNREVLLKKRNALLDKLAAAGKIDTGSCALAKLEPLPGNPLPLPQFSPHLLQRFIRDDKKNKHAVTKIITTLDATLQINVSRVIQQHQSILKGNGINNACALVLDVETGNTLAYVGNIYDPVNKEMESDVDVISAPRSPGSALKPILYAAMLSDGLILPNSIVPDIPTQIGGYTPQNFDLGYDGAVPAGKALSRSLNIPAIKLLQQYKYQRFYETLQQCGITTLNRNADNYGLSLILGGCEVTMWDLAGLYAGMARTLNHQTKNHGKMDPDDIHAPKYFESPPATNLHHPTSNIPLDATSIYFTFQAMQEVMRPGEEGLWQQFSSSQKIAWKTGTSFGFRDGWAIGITPKNVIAVWVGNTDGEGRPGLIGVQTAAPILFDILRLLPSATWWQRPTYNFSYIPVCRQSGFRANTDCPDIDTLFMPPNALKSPQCPYHKIIHLDATGLYRVTEQCASPSSMQHKSWFILSPAMEYYYKQKNADYKTLPSFMEGCGFAETGKVIELIYPQQDAKIYVPLEVTGEKGRTIFKAAHRRSSAKIFWSLDDEYIGTTQNFHQMGLNPSPGKHIITLVDETGISISRQFEILEKDNR